jgi:hypothetical protein
MSKRSGGLFSKDKSGCHSTCIKDSETNCKKYCTKTIGEGHAQKHLEELKTEIKRLTENETRARILAQNRKVAPKVDTFAKAYEEKAATVFNIGKGGSRKRKTIRKTKRKRKGGKSWSEYFWAKKPDLTECITTCKKEAHSACGKICDNASISTADEKIKTEITKSNEIIKKLNESIADWNRVSVH